ncbi:hypothetical protein NYQ83_12085 [Afifella sp. JA880]|uniref:hypothetical protein n=1 Tax=Afifella sp. JA880 TaxID=2975280 RepID=UPI0021BB3C7D|nr:hypothetical protein [Afifella sp. JA880]MCT8268014.1 hypothetical protein [Afifella sp. JA880]
MTDDGPYYEIEYLQRDKKKNITGRARMGSEYQFVPTAPLVEAAPLARSGRGDETTPELSHLRPVPGGLSGVICVDFIAETPVLFGMAQEEMHRVKPDPEKPHVVEKSVAVTRPTSLPLNGRNVFCMPGRAARGMIKSVYRIATASALEPVNKHHHFGSRFFEYRQLRGFSGGKGKPPIPSLGRGWLVPRQIKAGMSDETTWEWTLFPAGAQGASSDMSFADLAGFLSQEKQKRFQEDWRNYDLGRRRQQARQELFQKNLRDRLSDGEYLVITGSFGTKRKEAVFAAKSKGAEPILTETPGFHSRPGPIELFLKINSDYHKQGGVFPDGSTRSVTGNLQFFLADYAQYLRSQGRGGAEELLRDMGLPSYWGNPDSNGESDRPNQHAVAEQGFPGIPVYYIDFSIRSQASGASEKTGPNSDQIFLGTAQVFKIPHRFGVGDVHSRQPKICFDRKRFTDWTDALFGSEDAWGESSEPSTLRGRDREQTPLASRLRFSFAPADDAQPMESIYKVTQGAPKASFDPYYLWETDPDRVGPPPRSLKGTWDSETVVLAGHKRYPACRPFDESFGDPWAEEMALGKVESLVQPLKAGAKFRLEIRFENLHPLELGGLLWSLSFGDRRVFFEDGVSDYRHVGGRLRNKGLGRLRPAHARLKSLRQNPMPSGLCLSDLGDRNIQIDALLLAFESQMGRRFRAQYSKENDSVAAGYSDMKAFYMAPPIRTLINLSKSDWVDEERRAGGDSPIHDLPVGPAGNKLKNTKYFLPFVELRKALYLKTAYPDPSPYVKRPIEALLDAFFEPEAKIPDEALLRERRELAILEALRDPLAALRKWRQTD